MREDGNQRATSIASTYRGTILSKAGFTLAELLISITIMVILMMLLFPFARKMREAARAAHCKSNLHQIYTAFLLFASEHDSQLPGGQWDSNQAEPDYRDWVMAKPPDFSTAPQGGTIFKYLAGDPSVFRCPSLDVNPPRAGAIVGPFNGSNGHFDYQAMTIFSGARFGLVSARSQMLDANNQYQPEPTPLIVEEDPIYGNGFNLTGSHEGRFTMSHYHSGGGNYAAADGSVVWINEPQVTTPPYGVDRWQSIAPSGAWTSLGNAHPVWGSWNTK
ncbi:MAG TPA: DUF1559 domain-containing protein [Tepidisphaeraceae bacterium]|nr:DUF1559 domain-containing protein [Tepidisphaeraceae bacterium]